MSLILYTVGSEQGLWYFLYALLFYSELNIGHFKIVKIGVNSICVHVNPLTFSLCFSSEGRCQVQ